MKLLQHKQSDNVFMSEARSQNVQMTSPIDSDVRRTSDIRRETKQPSSTSYFARDLPNSDREIQ